MPKSNQNMKQRDFESQEIELSTQVQMFCSGGILLKLLLHTLSLSLIYIYTYIYIYILFFTAIIFSPIEWLINVNLNKVCV